MTEAIRGNVLALVAEMESKVSSNAEKASHTDVEQEMMKKAIIEALQDIENSAADRLSGLNAIKNFLSHLATQDLGADVNDYVKGELESANSYKPNKDLVNKLKEDEEDLKAAKEGIKEDTKAMADLDKKIAVLVKKLADAEDTLKHGSFFGRIGAYFEILGLDIALGALEIAKGVVWIDLKLNQGRLNGDQASVNQDQQALKNDPKILSCLDFLAAGDRVVTNQANQKIGMYRSLINDVSEIVNTVSAMAKSFNRA
ncbi:MAG TPA: hypothetical protein VGZ69_01545 [Candidatus Rhabdochlamydia sp.]|jgi:hypothetical protein|nr:hypothetical protein [Candidatus Rhabdochlamydia sp.]